jgi:acetoin utilization deacetylase AcuC-like enzyme
VRAWSSSRYSVALPPGHRFPITKYQAVREGVIARGLLDAGDIHEPERVERTALALVHTDAYVTAICDGTLGESEQRRLGFPWGPGLRERSFRTVQGTLEAARDALDGGAGVNLAGGTHHAFAERGEGFCVFNDVAVAARVLQREGRVRRLAVVDLDVHQGNGTARIFLDDPDVYTFSVHGARNYPFHRETSRLDVELPDRADDAAYLRALDAHLDDVLAESAPDLVFYLAGADPFAGDRFGRLGMSIEGLQRRDRRVFAACRRRGLPVAVTLAGGYAERMDDIVTIHANTVQELRAACG